MQGLSWWLYEADVVAHAVQEETSKKAGMALPRSFFSARSQRGLLALSGHAAVLRIADRDTFVAKFLALRFWLLQLGVVLQRTAVDPQPHCESEWIPTDRATGNSGQGYHGKWYTPGWPWPFHRGAGVVVGQCAYLDGATTPAPPRDCCSVIFGQVPGAKCLDTAHHMVLEQTLHRHRDEADASARLNLAEAMVDDAIDARKLRGLASRYKQPVLWIELADAAAPPPIYGLSASEKEFMKELVSSDRESGCADAPNMLRGIP